MADCPQFAEIVRLIRTEATDFVVVQRYDRLWRTSALQAQLSALCTEHRCQVYSVRQPQEPVDPSKVRRRRGLRGLQEVFSAAVSEEEQQIRVERHRTGMIGRILTGLHGTSAATPYGYRFVATDQPLEPDPITAPWALFILERRAAGDGYVQICQSLENYGICTATGKRQWSAQVVSQIVHNPYYVGHVRWGQAYNEHGSHQALISDETWQRILDINALRANRRYTTNRLFSGLCRCAYCGSALVYQHERNRHRLRLQCCLYSKTGGKKCRSNQLPEHRLRAFVLKEVRRVLSNPAAFRAAREESNHLAEARGHIAALDARIRELARARGRWDALYEVGGISGEELLGHRHRLIGEATELKGQRKRLADTVVRSEAAQQQIMEMRPLLDGLGERRDAQLREVYHALIQSIVIEKGQDPVVVWW